MTQAPTFRQRQAPAKITRRALCALAPAAMLGIGLGASPLARAQTAAAWTAAKPIRMVVPYSPGGSVDVIARIVAQGIGSKLGQPIIVENKPGASGAIGSDFVYRERPDGHVIEMTSNDTHSIYPHVNPKVRYNATEFTPLSSVVLISSVLMGRPDLPAKSLANVVQLSQQKELTYATWGVGTTPHVAMEMLRLATKMPKMVQVSYKGAAPALQAVMSGEVDLMMVPSALAGSYRGKLVTIGVAAPERHEAFKDVSTLTEQGVSIDSSAWIALVGPPKMPAPIADTIHKAVQDVLHDPEVQKRLRESGMTPHIATRPQFESYLAKEYGRWGEVVREAKITVDE